jgi:hypothetical protein
MQEIDAIEQVKQPIEAAEATNGLSTNHSEMPVNINNSVNESNTFEKTMNNESLIVEKMNTDQHQQQLDKQGDNCNLPKDLNIKNDSKFRENLYRLIISQLFYDGHQPIAVGLSNIVQVSKVEIFTLLF